MPGGFPPPHRTLCYVPTNVLLWYKDVMEKGYSFPLNSFVVLALSHQEPDILAGVFTSWIVLSSKSPLDPGLHSEYRLQTFTEKSHSVLLHPSHLLLVWNGCEGYWKSLILQSAQCEIQRVIYPIVILSVFVCHQGCQVCVTKPAQWPIKTSPKANKTSPKTSPISEL